MANFEEIQEDESYTDSEYEEDEDEYSVNNESIFLSESESELESGSNTEFNSDSDLSVDFEDLDKDTQNEIFLDEMKILIENIIEDNVKCLEDLNDVELLNEDDLFIMNYFQEQDNNFKINILKVIFAKLILLQFNDTISIKNITNISITLEPFNVDVNGLNEEETEKINSFFMNYLETK